LNADTNWIDGCFEWYQSKGGQNEHTKKLYYNKRSGATTGNYGGNRMCSQATPANTITVMSIDHSSGTTGQYLNFDAPSGWTSHQAVDVKQCRNGQTIWSGRIMWWNNQNGGTSGNSHGRRDSGSSSGQWQVGDTVTDGICQAMDHDHKVAVLYEGKVVQPLVLLDAKAHAAEDFSINELAADLAAKVREKCPGFIKDACLKFAVTQGKLYIGQMCLSLNTPFAFAGAGVQGIITSFCVKTISDTLKTALQPGAANFGSHVCSQMGL